LQYHHVLENFTIFWISSLKYSYYLLLPRFGNILFILNRKTVVFARLSKTKIKHLVE
jgi:hypothetical protein